MSRSTHRGVKKASGRREGKGKRMKKIKRNKGKKIINREKNETKKSKEGNKERGYIIGIHYLFYYNQNNTNKSS